MSDIAGKQNIPTLVNPYITDGLVVMFDCTKRFHPVVHNGAHFSIKQLEIDDDGIVSQLNAETQNFDYGEYGNVTIEFVMERISLSPLISIDLSYDKTVASGCSIKTNPSGEQIQFLSFLANKSMANQVGHSIEGNNSYSFCIGGNSIQTSTPKRMKINNVSKWDFNFAGYRKPADGKLVILSNSAVKLKTLRIYNRILSDSEVAFNYTIDRERFGVGGVS